MAAFKYNFVSVDRVLAKHHRDMRGLDIHETDTIEWIGEALGFMKIPNASEEAVAFLEVKNYQATLPCNLHYILQVAKYNAVTQLSIQDVTYNTVAEPAGTTETTSEETQQLGVCLDEYGNLIPGTEYAYYRPYFDLQYEYLGWANSALRQRAFSPVKLAEHSFFNSIVAKECNDKLESLYQSCQNEYTVVPKTSALRFSFKEGFVAIAFTRQMMDDDCYPMVPDNQYCLNAIEYYLKWKLMERHFYAGRQGAREKKDDAEMHWIRYLGKFKSFNMMPTGLDDYEDLKNIGNYMVPRQKLYDNYFGNLSRPEQRPFNHPRSNS